MLITIIAWILLIVNGLVCLFSFINIFTRKTTGERVESFGSVVYAVFTIILALGFIYG
ncbi:hypothetical protein [Intestinibacter bartlettii]|jgi:hypothetical protein|uniref:hypothetical protein n=1 Tax=Intestinibacter bartlettii TaxID=261299 RepID=UPI00319E0EED